MLSCFDFFFRVASPSSTSFFPFSSPRLGCRGLFEWRSFRDDPIVPTERVYPPKKGEPDGERGDQWLIVLLVTSCDSSEEGMEEEVRKRRLDSPRVEFI